MSEAGNQNEQSMDEILASIRKIISDDPAPSAPENSGAPVVNESPAQTQAPGGQGDDLADILEPMTETSAGKFPAPDALASVAGRLAPKPKTLAPPTTVPQSTDKSSSVAAQAASAPAGGAWPFDSRPKDESVGVGLQNKLASLDELNTPAPTPAEPRDISVDGASLEPSPPPEAPRAAVFEPPAARAGVAAEPERTEIPTPMLRDGASAGAPRSPLREQSAASAPAGTVAFDDRPSRIIDRDVQPDGAPLVDGGEEVPAGETVNAQAAPLAEAPSVSGGGSSATARDSDVGGLAPVVAAAVVKDISNSDDSTGQRSLEDVVVEALRPMLQDWIDANLPRITEEIVKAEMKRQADQNTSKLKI